MRFHKLNALYNDYQIKKDNITYTLDISLAPLSSYYIAPSSYICPE